MKSLFFNALNVVVFLVATSSQAGEFAQLDVSSGSQTVVALKSFDSGLKVGAVWSQWEAQGRSISTQAVMTIPTQLEGWRFNAGVNAIAHRSTATDSTDADSTSAMGVKVGAEHFAQVAGADTFAMVELSSAFRSWLAVAQVRPHHARWSAEWSAVGDERWYVGRRLAWKYPLSEKGVYLRIGKQWPQNGIFAGLSFENF